MMTREECEKAIFEKMLEIKSIYNQYNSDDGYLAVTFLDDGGMMCMNGVKEDTRRIDFYHGANFKDYEIHSFTY